MQMMLTPHDLGFICGMWLQPKDQSTHEGWV
jgi:hypothetical protein